MPASLPSKVRIACPQCGHEQLESSTFVSTYCRKCGNYFAAGPVSAPQNPARAGPPQRRVTCFDCGAELFVPASAESTMCKRCSSYVDLKSYHIVTAVSKNFKTKGSLILEPKGYVFNTVALVGDAILRGRFHGRITAERSLTIYSTAEIKGGFQAGRLIIPEANNFRWTDKIQVTTAEIAGELAAHVCAAGTVILKSTARMFGGIEAQGLVVEEGAVMVGRAQVGVGR